MESNGNLLEMKGQLKPILVLFIILEEPRLKKAELSFIISFFFFLKKLIFFLQDELFTQTVTEKCKESKNE